MLVEPAYYTRYPPLGLLKLASYHRSQGDEVIFQRGMQEAVDPPPKLILVSSLFTYSWRPVHQAVDHLRELYPKAEIQLGGIYATLMPEHAALSGAEVHKGLRMDVERYRPDYSLTPDWDSSILFGTRGCIRKCAFCAVPRLEGKTWGPAEGIKDLVHPDHRKVVLWDNNILGVPNWREVIDELRELDVEVDFNQGLDARLITEEVAQKLAEVRIRPIRMAYDIPNERKALERAIPLLEAAGFRRRAMIVYTLYNFTDNPDEFLKRVIDLLDWGVVSYPMRYEPLNSLVKNRYISPHWTVRQVEMVARARRVMGYGGAFPPYKPLLQKLKNAESFEEALSMRSHPLERKAWPEAAAGSVETRTNGVSPERAAFTELLNDPATLQHAVRCELCNTKVPEGDRAFAVQDYSGKYVGYVCPSCHPNRKWVNGLWRSVFGEHFSGEPVALRTHPLPLITRTVH